MQTKVKGFWLCQVFMARNIWSRIMTPSLGCFTVPMGVTNLSHAMGLPLIGTHFLTVVMEDNNLKITPIRVEPQLGLELCSYR